MRQKILVAIAFLIFTLLPFHLKALNDESEKTLHLSRITLINGYYCKGWIATTNTGRLISFDNAAPIRIKNGVIPVGSRIGLYPNLSIQSVCLGKPTRIQGLTCVGYGTESPAIIFYPNGNLKICYLDADTWIQGIPCHHGFFSKVVLQMDGKLRSCELAKTIKINGHIIKERSILVFDSNGKIERVRKANLFRSFLFDILDKIL